MFETLEKVSAFLKWMLAVSRPRIWIYTAGFFILGAVIAPRSLYFFERKDLLIILSLWLTLPANLFLYAINDAFDYETDRQNPKKQGFEIYGKPDDRKKLITTAFFCLLTLVPILFLLPVEAVFMVVLWIALVLSYNLPPLRLKKIPIWDNLFSFNFPLWGVVGYFLVSNQLPDYKYLPILGLFAITMHIYTSAVDLEYDKRAGIITTSVIIGSLRNNLIACLILLGIAISALIVFNIYAAAVVLFGYEAFFAIQLFLKNNKTPPDKWYKYFIRLHYALGLLLGFLT